MIRFLLRRPLAQALLHFLETRFVKNKGAPRQGEQGGGQYVAAGGKEARNLVEEMGACLDLRALCQVPCALEDRVEALRSIHTKAAESGARPPPLETLEEELETLRTRLVAAAGEPRFKRLWFDDDAAAGGKVKSGTVIMKSLFTEKELWGGIGALQRGRISASAPVSASRRRACWRLCRSVVFGLMKASLVAAQLCHAGNILWLFEHCALKIRNEAVVEGMGSIVNLHADPRRHLSSAAYNAEAWIHYNGPPLPKAKGIIEEALDLHFGGRDNWHFVQASSKGMRSVFSVTSEVVQRHQQQRGRLPCWE